MSSEADGHRYFEGMAVSHVLGGLDESEGRVFRSHLLECVDCRARVGELRAIAHELADVERDERRLRAAKTVETKRREAEDDDTEEAESPAPNRIVRVLGVVGLGLITVLFAFNFTLRANTNRQAQLIERLEEAARVLQLGEPATVTPRVADVQAKVAVRDSRIVILVDGLEDDATYGVWGLDADGEVTFSRDVVPRDGTVYELVQAVGGTRELVVYQLVGDTLTREPSGTRILDAVLPATR